MALHGWDQETYMPAGAGNMRAAVFAELGNAIHSEMTRPGLLSLLREELDSLPAAEPWAACVRNYLRDCERKAMIPASLDRELNTTSSLAQQAWSQSRSSGDASAFHPLLHKLIMLKRDEVACLAQDSLQGYDVLLDSFEPGMRSATLDHVFGQLHKGLQEILAEMRDRHFLDCEAPLPGNFAIAQQEQYAHDLLKRMGFDFSRGRIDLSAHPFTEGVTSDDVRLTTRFRTDDFLDSFFTVLHEGGHGLYEQGFDARWQWTPLAEAVSLGVHESQSRFWENIIGRSESFWAGELSRARAHFPDLQGVSIAQVLKRVRRVKPSLIRVESDEVTYNLHVMLRYRIEKALFEGSLDVADISENWNQLSEELLGVIPGNDREGYLQDVHWSAGLFGYFPTYALGNLYSAQLEQSIRRDLVHFDSILESGNWSPILAWLREHVHTHGRRFTAVELMENATGSKLAAEPFLAYLRQRYLRDCA